MKPKLPEPVELQGERLVLRPLRPSDAGILSLYAGDERVARMTSRIPHPLPPGATEAFLRMASSANRKETIWAMDASSTEGPELLGVIGAEPLDSGAIEVGYWVGPPFWGTGYATEAVDCLSRHLLNLGVPVLFASIFEDNVQSQRVVEKAGFAPTGAGEVFSVARDCMMITREFERRRASRVGRKVGS